MGLNKQAQADEVRNLI